MPAFASFVTALALLAVAPRLALAAQGEPEKGASSFEYFHAFAMDAEGRTLFLGAHFGLLRSEDGGLSWRRVTLPSKRPHLDVMAVAPDPKDATVVYVATHEAGVFKSTDGGRGWAEVNTGLGGLDVHGLAGERSR